MMGLLFGCFFHFAGDLVGEGLEAVLLHAGVVRLYEVDDVFAGFFTFSGSEEDASGGTGNSSASYCEDNV